MINQARKIVLFNENPHWDKRESKDVPRGCFDGTELFELVGTYILNQLKDAFQRHSVGLNKDEDFAVVKDLSRPEIEIMKSKSLKS